MRFNELVSNRFHAGRVGSQNHEMCCESCEIREIQMFRSLPLVMDALPFKYLVRTLSTLALGARESFERGLCKK